jgi:hypothetical protein
MGEVYLAIDTDFSENAAGPFAYSQDGKTIAFVRAATRDDVVLISDFR